MRSNTTKAPFQYKNTSVILKKVKRKLLLHVQLYESSESDLYVNALKIFYKFSANVHSNANYHFL